MKAVAIVNPRAGFGAAKALKELAAGMDPWGPMPLWHTEHSGHARELALKALDAGCDTVLSVGGDGTANETAQALINTQTALGILPFGSGNGLARALRIPIRSFRHAVDSLRDAERPAMDVGLIQAGDAEPLPFLNVAGTGLDAAIGAAFQSHGSEGGRRGIASYFSRGFPVAWHYRAKQYAIEADGAPLWNGRALFVTCANGPQFGAEAVIAPGALLDDGFLDVVAIEALNILAVTSHAHRLFTRSISTWRRYHRFKVPSLTIRAEESGMLFHRDGEPSSGTTPLQISLAPKALRVLVPRTTMRSPARPFTR